MINTKAERTKLQYKITVSFRCPHHNPWEPSKARTPFLVSFLQKPDHTSGHWTQQL